ncbi:MAG: hypothetical protein IJP16_00520 [Clostridia bacterium]|nr:hypothetical protein [Clostridia bacterium]
MQFISPNGLERPVRLSEKTRLFAYESLNRKYGLDTRKTPSVTLDSSEGMTELEKYDTAIRKIVTEAPVRICDGELISGAATLGRAIFHEVPAVYNGKALFSSISHLTVDFESVLKIGIDGIRKKAEESLSRHIGCKEEEFLRSCINTLDSFDIWHKRYLDLTDGRLSRVPHKPAETFLEAVQSIWFTFAFIRLCGNWTGIGRIDAMLGEYLDRDLECGRLTLDGAREILAHFFIKGCEWVSGGDYGSGDAQHYQNIILAGVDENGAEVTNRVTYLVLDIIEELGISDFPITVRINRNSDKRLLRRVSEVMRYGGGILAIYNEDLIIDTLVKNGYPLSEARSFANDGCWEVQIPGKTFFVYSPFDSLQVLQKTLKKTYSTYEELYSAYISDLKELCDKIYTAFTSSFEADNLFEWKRQPPCTVVSIFEQGCIEKGRSYLEGGPIYNLVSLHIGGVPDVANSLYAIKKAVFEEKKASLDELQLALASNWEGFEELRLHVMNKYKYYGNGNAEVDGIVAEILDAFADICDSFNGKCGYTFPAGVSTFGRQLEWAPLRTATASGRKSGEVLSPNLSPLPSTDSEGATAVIRSYCTVDHSRLASGSALDLKLVATSIKGERGLDALGGLIRTFIDLGGFFMQPDVASADLLRMAQKSPEDFKTLSVRVSGWSARFVTLNKEWQNMIIAQNE